MNKQNTNNTQEKSTSETIDRPDPANVYTCGFRGDRFQRGQANNLENDIRNQPVSITSVSYFIQADYTENRIDPTLLGAPPNRVSEGNILRKYLHCLHLHCKHVLRNENTANTAR